jgi:hypothetical protein
VKIYASTTSKYSGFADTGVVDLTEDSTSATVNGLTNAKYWFKLVVTGGTRAGDSNVIIVEF